MLTPLTVSGLTFGDGWQYRGSTDFAALWHFVQGVDLRPLYDQRCEAGANLLRVLSMARNLFPLDPASYADEQLDAFLADVHAHDLRVELVALADTGAPSGATPEQQSLGWQRAHADRIAEAVRRAGGVDLFELVNEFDTGWQNINPQLFERPQGIIASRGSGGGGTWCPLPAWDYATYHIDRNSKWVRNLSKTGLDLVAGFPGYDGTHAPLVHNEPEKFGDGRPLTSAREAWIAGVQCAVWRNEGIGGGCFHCASGLQSMLWTPDEETAARAFFAGMHAASSTESEGVSAMVITNAALYTHTPITGYLDVTPEPVGGGQIALKHGDEYVSVRDDGHLDFVGWVGANETFRRDGNRLVAIIGEGPRVLECA